VVIQRYLKSPAKLGLVASAVLTLFVGVAQAASSPCPTRCPSSITVPFGAAAKANRAYLNLNATVSVDLFSPTFQEPLNPVIVGSYQTVGTSYYLGGTAVSLMGDAFEFAREPYYGGPIKAALQAGAFTAAYMSLDMSSLGLVTLRYVAKFDAADVAAVGHAKPPPAVLKKIEAWAALGLRYAKSVNALIQRAARLLRGHRSKANLRLANTLIAAAEQDRAHTHALVAKAKKFVAST
jgi:hypothetical protein